jgi:hypothetical protein
MMYEATSEAPFKQAVLPYQTKNRQTRHGSTQETNYDHAAKKACKRIRKQAEKTTASYINRSLAVPPAFLIEKQIKLA